MVEKLCLANKRERELEFVRRSKERKSRRSTCYSPLSHAAQSNCVKFAQWFYSDTVIAQ